MFGHYLTDSSLSTGAFPLDLTGIDDIPEFDFDHSSESDGTFAFDNNDFLNSYVEVELSKAVKLFELSQFKEAVDVLTTIWTLQHKSEHISILLAFSYMNLREFDLALTLFDLIIEHTPVNPEVLVWRAKALCQKECPDFQEAVSTLSVALRLDVNHLPSLQLRAYTYYKLREYDFCIEDFLAIVKYYSANSPAEPNDIKMLQAAYALLAHAYHHKRNYEQALFYVKLSTQVNFSIVPMFEANVLRMICSRDRPFYNKLSKYMLNQQRLNVLADIMPLPPEKFLDPIKQKVMDVPVILDCMHNVDITSLNEVEMSHKCPCCSQVIQYVAFESLTINVDLKKDIESYVVAQENARLQPKSDYGVLKDITSLLANKSSRYNSKASSSKMLPIAEEKELNESNGSSSYSFRRVF